MGQGGWEGDTRGRGYGDICIHIADSFCFTGGTNNIVKQLYSNKDVKKTNLETIENRNTKYQNLWDAAKEILRRKFIVIKTYIKKKEISSKQPNFTSQGSRNVRTN